MATVLVIGASRGIGLEFVRQYAAEGARVIATVRREEDAARLRELGAKPLVLDVLDEATVAHFGVQLQGEKLDAAIYNAGVYGPRSSAIAAPGGLDFDSVMHTNVRAPMQLIPQLVPGLAATGGKLALISSRMGSISLMSSTSGWLYRASKAAANAVLRSASLELGPHGIVCIAFHPGWVRTEMGGAGADIDAATSVAGMRRVLASANASQSGKFLNFNGEQLSW
jgi:NAD(P)-dependent dehydrogenase (short-subunit alcohol dehydrogenase family)